MTAKLWTDGIISCSDLFNIIVIKTVFLIQFITFKRFYWKNFDFVAAKDHSNSMMYLDSLAFSD